MTRLIVVSNRVSAPNPDSTGSQGGLAVALSEALRESRGIWFGWSGERTDQFTGHVNFQRAGGVTSATLDLEDQDVDEYYNGYANRTLWPLFHYRTDLVEFDRQFDAGYARANDRFAETLLPILEPDDLIWVHDYHLIPLGRALRKRGVRNRIGFFLHTPWPPSQLLMTLPNHRDLIAALFDYDLIGLQTREWLDAFLDYCRVELDAAPTADGDVTAFGRTVRVGAYPIGIDSETFTEASASEEALHTHARMVRSVDGRAMLIGVDRLDYSKGIEERFLGYERFLADNPAWLGRTFLLQIAPPTRSGIGSYEEIRSRLDSVSGRINGAFSDIDWVPVRYVNRGYPRATLAGVYRAAHVGLVTPLRDGMNLVAKEYVAAQDRANPGVLVLSRFAGAAEQMRDALIVNPHSQEEIAEAILAALDMPLDERIRRHEALLHGVLTDNVGAWRRHYVSDLAAVQVHAAAP
jgi:trehalose 6-phosphate synthase